MILTLLVVHLLCTQYSGSLTPRKYQVMFAGHAASLECMIRRCGVKTAQLLSSRYAAFLRFNINPPRPYAGVPNLTRTYPQLVPAPGAV